MEGNTRALDWRWGWNLHPKMNNKWAVQEVKPENFTRNWVVNEQYRKSRQGKVKQRIRKIWSRQNGCELALPKYTWNRMMSVSVVQWSIVWWYMYVFTWFISDFFLVIVFNHSTHKIYRNTNKNCGETWEWFSRWKKKTFHIMPANLSRALLHHENINKHTSGHKNAYFLVSKVLHTLVKKSIYLTRRLGAGNQKLQLCCAENVKFIRVWLQAGMFQE